MRTNLTNEELKAEGKRSAVTFKMPESDDRLGKSVSDIAAGNGICQKYTNIIIVNLDNDILITLPGTDKFDLICFRRHNGRCLDPA